MNRLPIPRLAPEPDSEFPPLSRALRDPDGLLAMGGDLSPTRLLNAYRRGIFPWFSTGQPILWWSPDPRLVFDSGSFRLASRFRRQLRNCNWVVRSDTCFADVIHACAEAPRPGQPGSWLIGPMREAYGRLHELGHAHSIEVHAGDRLVGGIYGVAVGRMFFGESMFSAESGGSKLALAALLRLLNARGWPLLDAQVENPHLLSLGGRRMARGQFMAEVERLVVLPGIPGPWTAEVPDWPASTFS